LTEFLIHHPQSKTLSLKDILAQSSVVTLSATLLAAAFLAYSMMLAGLPFARLVSLEDVALQGLEVLFRSIPFVAGYAIFSVITDFFIRLSQERFWMFVDSKPIWFKFAVYIALPALILSALYLAIASPIAPKL